MREDLSVFIEAERVAAIQWARGLLSRQDWIILDTETTGLDSWAEVCQVGIILPSGTTILDSLVKPTVPIPADATRIHGISDETVTGAPSFWHVAHEIQDALNANEVVVYNLDYDLRLMAQSAAAIGWTWFRPWTALPRPSHCAMRQYAKFVGEWNAYHGSFRWQKLPPIPGETAHSAIADCRATLALIKRMAEAQL